MASRDRPFVAVLPLENLSPDEENAFFADGIHEEVLSQLSKVAGLGVFARTTMTQYEDTEKSVYEIGQELDAQAVLEGSVRRSGNRVRISAQLIDPQSRDHLWSETYERTLSTDAVFDIQADIAEQIAGALETRLAGEERQRIEDAPTDDLAAYDAYLSGRNSWWQIWTTRDYRYIDRSVERLQEAVRRDSTFAEAHAWLALAYGARYSISDNSRWLDSALAAVGRARDLGPISAIVHAADGHVLFWQGSMDAAELALREALKLQPSNSFAVSTLALVCAWRYEWPESVRWAHRAIQLDPR